MHDPNDPGTQAYTLVVAVYTYVIDIITFTCAGLGMLYLRLAPGSKWHAISEANHWISIIASLILATAHIVPLVCLWIPDQKPQFRDLLRTKISWYIPQTVAVIAVTLSFVYWLGFRYVIPHLGNHTGRKFVIEREPRFHEEYGHPVLTFETITTGWQQPNPSVADPKLIERERRFVNS